MVRVWAWELTEHLDDNRLPAAHAETHYMLGALARGEGAWWLHPETQYWHGREPQLRWIHDYCASWMTKRGVNHRSPTPGDRAAWMAPTEDAKMVRDLADLYRKWVMEGRVNLSPIPNVLAGAVRLDEDLRRESLGKLKNGHPVWGFHPARQPRSASWAVLLKMMHAAELLEPAREWTKGQSVALKKLVSAESRGPTPDLTRDERQSLLPAGWSDKRKTALLNRIHREVTAQGDQVLEGTKLVIEAIVQMAREHDWEVVVNPEPSDPHHVPSISIEAFGRYVTLAVVSE